jgi:4-hydroxy-3-methylbut-2-enyl diphosphate reductase
VDLDGVVGLTAGASAPEALVQAVLAKLAPRDGVELVHITTEDEYFPPPPELRELLRALGATLGALTGAPNDAGADVLDDRVLSAAEVLAALAS